MSFKISDRPFTKELYFKIRRDTPLRRAFNVFCQGQSVNKERVIFELGEDVIDPESTAAQIGLTEKDTIICREV